MHSGAPMRRIAPMAEALNSTPAADGFSMPAEYAPHECTWMLWPHRADTWRDNGDAAQQAYAAMAAAIAEAEPLKMGVRRSQIDAAKALLPSGVEIIELDSDDAWMRDCGPTFVTNGAGQRRGVDWQFNAWGGKDEGIYSDWELDQKVAEQVIELEGNSRYSAPLILEGGSIHVDGEGTCMTTEECLLNKNRNPSMTREQIEGHLFDYLGVEKVLWLGAGTFGDETNGHVDNIACFVRPGVVVMTWTDDESHPQHAISLDARSRLEAMTDAKGRSLQVELLPMPSLPPMTEQEAAGIAPSDAVLPRLAGEELAGSYVNFYIANGRIVAPLLDERTDDEAMAKLAELFPQREVVGLPGREILLGGGNVHCITQQVPLP